MNKIKQWWKSDPSMKEIVMIIIISGIATTGMYLMGWIQ